MYRDLMAGSGQDNRTLRRFRGPNLDDESAVTRSLWLAVPLFDLNLGDLSSNERPSWCGVSKVVRISRALKQGVDGSEMRGFFAALRMTTVEIMPIILETGHWHWASPSAKTVFPPPGDLNGMIR
jgi:hypothetical protein